MSQMTMEQQIASLTPEQRASMKPIYRRYALCLVASIVLAVVVTVVLFLIFRAELAKAEEEYDRLDRAVELEEQKQEMFGGFIDLDLLAAHSDAMEHYFDCKGRTFVPFIIGGFMLFALALVVMVVFKVKYPFFSEKRYGYLKKQMLLSQTPPDTPSV